MASLQDIVKQNKKLVKGPGGVLSEEEDQNPDLQQLVGQAGLASPPTDPISAGVLGANQHTQKMMGSPAQVQSAIRIAQDPTKNLGTQQREQQARSQATAGEQAQQQKGENLKELGGLGDRVNQFIEAQRLKLASADPTTGTQQVAPDATLAGLPKDPAQLQQVKDAAQSLIQNPQDQESLLKLNKLLGRDKSSLLTGEELNKLYVGAVDTISGAGAQAVQDNLNVQDLVSQGNFGFDIPTLSSLLNVPPNQLSRMSVKELSDTVHAVSQNEFSGAAQNQQKAGNGELGAAERQAARSFGQEQSRVGTKASESDFRKLDQAVQESDHVSFGGQFYAVEDLLKDDTISGIIKDYMNLPPGDPRKHEIEKSEPSLVSFINKHQAVLDDAAKNMEQGAGEFSSIQKYNEDQTKVGNAQLSPDLIKALMPEAGGLSSKRLDASQIPVLAAARGLPPAQGEAMIASLNDLVSNPQTSYLKDELLGLKPDQVQALHLEQGANSPVLKTLLESIKQGSQLQNLDGKNPAQQDQIAQMYTGGKAGTAQDLQTLWNTAQTAKTLGLTPPDTSALDHDKDGKLDTPEQMAEWLRGNWKPPTLQDALNYGVKPVPSENVSKAQTSYAPGSIEQTLMEKVGPQVQKYGSLESAMAHSQLTPDDYFDIVDSGILRKWPEQEQRFVQGELDNARREKTNSILKDFGTTKDESLISELDSDKYPHQGEDVNLGRFIKLKAPAVTEISSLRQDADELSKQKDALQSQIDAINGMPDREKRKVSIATMKGRMDELDAHIQKFKSTADAWQKQRDSYLALLKEQQNGGGNGTVSPNLTNDVSNMGPGQAYSSSSSGTVPYSFQKSVLDRNKGKA